jgi:hypothetical protein
MQRWTTERWPRAICASPRNDRDPQWGAVASAVLSTAKAKSEEGRS